VVLEGSYHISGKAVNEAAALLPFHNLPITPHSQAHKQIFFYWHFFHSYFSAAFLKVHSLSLEMLIIFESINTSEMVNP